MSFLRATLVVLLSVSTGTAEVRADAAALITYLDGLRSFAATFEQQRFDEDGALLETSSGECLVERPGRFRWRYAEPYPQTIVSDGETLWIYDVDLEQVTVSEIGDAPPDSPAALLGQDIDVAAHYAITVDGAADDGLHWYTLAPRAARADFARIALALGDGEVRAMRLYDNLGQVTAIAFRDVRRNAPVAADAFAFVPPSGVDVIRGAMP